ncbi:3-oxoadipyl-CoA thiolase [Cognatazoarcus halotolerans]|uniref:3-oxoadipyl-CoA thiolase n=1 Tax=Cognatazoarcus halotolerans TaxID=2686016 RepID=UPI00135C81F4|nr:3-oxoadipyl-CoA thiolase [Cognatazoarcus halotolerans]MCB1900643.1 3-oxoadipyl-CoA thiolase [Rhodocyclaceae bacterium]MCP5309165.1 3-oxoadipyl-CoA thiolase [Zoogloeaceae bacterium]
MLDAYIYDGLRSPIGRHGGALAPVRPDDLAAAVIRALVDRSAFDPAGFEDVILGCAAQSGEDGRNVARHAALLAGLPETVAGQTVNRLCGSGLAALLDSARAVSCGEGSLFVAGGVESMSRAPFVVGKPEAAWSRDFKVFDTTIGARFPNPDLVASYGNDSMPETADNVAAEIGIDRAASDRFAAASQAKYAAARDAGFFTDEILPIEVPTGRKKPPRIVCEDEHPRPDTTVESLASLKPLFGGVVTAGNASGINDGAAALIVGSRAAGESAGVRARGRILAGAVVGVAPRVMGIGPAFAIPRALERAGLALADIDVIEINEAFAPQVLGCLKLLGLDFGDPRVNPNGGGIALGHPLGASGARIALTALRELERRGGRYAVVSLCIGVGQGIALVLERCEQ